MHQVILEKHLALWNSSRKPNCNDSQVEQVRWNGKENSIWNGSCQLQVLSDNQVEQVRAVRTHQDLIRTRTQWSFPAILGVRWCLSDSYLRGAIEGGVFLSEVGWLTNHSYKLSSPKSPEVRSTIKNIFITHTHTLYSVNLIISTWKVPFRSLFVGIALKLRFTVEFETVTRRRLRLR